MEKNLNIKKPGYSECIWSVPWPFIISRFHCKMLKKFCLKLKYTQIAWQLNVCTAILSFPQEQTSKDIILCSMTRTVITIIISECF